MNVSIRDLVASCTGCGGSDFTQVNGGALRLATRMTCAACGKETTYRELLDQIGEEAMRRANDSLAKLKRNSSRRPKPRK